MSTDYAGGTLRLGVIVRLTRASAVLGRLRIPTGPRRTTRQCPLMLVDRGLRLPIGNHLLTVLSNDRMLRLPESLQWKLAVPVPGDE